jgi:hypothetical protein
MNVKYGYDKKNHLRDTINRFQGMEMKHIDANILSLIEQALDQNGLVDVQYSNNERLKRYKM